MSKSAAHLRGESHFDLRHTPEPTNSPANHEAAALLRLVRLEKFSLGEVAAWVTVTPAEREVLAATLDKLAFDACIAYRENVLMELQRKGGNMADRDKPIDPLARLAKNILSTQALASDVERSHAKAYLESVEFLRKRLEERRGN